MKFVMDYEIAAAGILTIFLIAYHMKNHLSTKLNRTFLYLTFSVLLVNIVDIISALLTWHQSSALNWLNYLINIILFILQAVMYMLFAVFALTLAESSKALSRRIMAALLAITAVYLMLVVTTPVFHLIFYITPEGLYRYGKLHSLIYIAPCISLMSGFFLLLGRRRRIKKTQLISTCLFSGIILGAVIIQALFIPHILIAYFFTTLGLLLIYFSFQSPEYYLDHATDAFNDRGLHEILKDHLLMKRPVSVVAVYPGNMDMICETNDQFAQDQVMILLKKGILTVLPNSIPIYRVNDIFCLLYESEDEADKIAGLLLSGLSGKYTLSGSRLPIEADILLLNAPRNFNSFEELLSILRYFSQNTAQIPHNEILTYDDKFTQQKKRYDTICKMLRLAIRQETISIFYQPFYSAEEHNFHSAEALVRLDGESAIGPVSPDEFIPIAEKENLIFDLGALVIKKICLFCKTHRPWELGIRGININLSIKQCMQKDLFLQIENYISIYGLQPSYFTFELTETSIADAKQPVLYNMEQLRQAGCVFALDDFGSGYSNLNYLLDFPFKIVKLDKELIWSYFKRKDEKSRLVLEHVIQMLHAMNMIIVAEGVEDLTMSEYLTKAGVQYLQGFLYSPALSEADFLNFLQ